MAEARCQVCGEDFAEGPTSLDRERFARRVCAACEQDDRVTALMLPFLYDAVTSLVAIVRVVVPLAAAAQAGRCRCGAAVPWHRMGWASPHCDDISKHGKWCRHNPTDDMCVEMNEKKAEAICGITAPRGWSLR